MVTVKVPTIDKRKRIPQRAIDQVVKQIVGEFKPQKIILFGMDFGKKIGRYSHTKVTERKIKLKKLRKGKSLLEWLSGKTRSQLFTTSSPIRGFEKISYDELDIIIT